jgi:hypothetical protein
MTLPEHHELHKLGIFDVEPTTTIDEFLAGKSLSEVQQILIGGS